MPADALLLTLTLVLSLSVGLLMGVIGGGGSFVYLLLLLIVAGLPARLAVGTGLVLGTAGSASATWRHLRAGAADWQAGAALVAVTVPAALAGAAATRVVPSRILVGLLIVAMAALTLLPLFGLRDPGGTGSATAAGAGTEPPGERAVRVSRWRWPVAAVIGVGTGAFGLAGGAPLAGYLATVERRPAVSAVGTALVAVTVTSGGAAVLHIALGQVSWTWVALLGAGAVAGAYLGAALMARLPHRAVMIGLGGLSFASTVGLVIGR